MCESNAYIKKEGKEELYLESVDLIRPEGNRVYMRSIFGEERFFDGKIKEISLVKHRILLEEK
jgi:predicted RNA-binding protein